MEQSYAIEDILGALRRRAGLIVLIFSLGAAATLTYVLSLPSVFESQARIVVEQQQISDDLARSTVNLTAAQRLQLIQERLMSRSALTELIDDLGIFRNAPHLDVEDRVALLRAATRFETTSSVGANWGNDAGLFAFTITVQFGTPEGAAAIAAELVDRAIAQNLRERGERARETLAHFEREATRVDSAIQALEAEIAAFKRRHEEELPEAIGLRREELARLDASDLELSRRIAELENERGTLSITLARTDSTVPGGLASPELNELRELELQLAQRRRVLAANHPEIRQLESRMAAVRDLARADSDGDAGPSGPADEQAAIRAQLDMISARIERVQDQRAQLALRRAELAASIGGAPEVEIALSAYERRMDELQDLALSVARRRAEAQTGEQLEASRQSERFLVIEQPLASDRAVGPKRKQLAVVGSGVSAVLALGVSLAFELLNPVLRTSRQMERQLGVRPVVVIPYVATPRERRRRRLVRAGFAAAVLGGAVLAVWATDRYLVPLEGLLMLMTPAASSGTG